MNLYYNVIMEVLDNIPWFVLTYAIYVVSKVQPKELVLKVKEFMLQWYK